MDTWKGSTFFNVLAWNQNTIKINTMLQWIGKNVNFDYIKKYGTSAVCFFAIEPITVCYFFAIFCHMVLHVCVQSLS